MAGKFFGPVRWRFSGNRTLAQRYVGVARSLLGQLEESMGFQALMHLRHEWRIPSGVVITALSTHGQRMVYIHAPEPGARYFPSACISKLIMDSGFVHAALNPLWQEYPLRVGLTHAVATHRSNGMTIDKSVIPTGAGVKKTQTYAMLPPPKLTPGETGAKDIVTTDYGRLKNAIFPVCKGALFTRPNYPDLDTDDIGRYQYYESLIVTKDWGLQGQPYSPFPLEAKALPAYRWTGMMRLFVQAKHGVGYRIEPEADARYDPDKCGLLISDDFWSCYLVNVDTENADHITVYPMVQGVSRGYVRLLANPTFTSTERTRMLSYMLAYLEPKPSGTRISLGSATAGSPFVYGWHWAYKSNRAVIFTAEPVAGPDRDGDENYYFMRRYTLRFPSVTDSGVSVQRDDADEGKFRPDARSNFMLYENNPVFGKIHTCLMPPDPTTRPVGLGGNVSVYGFFKESETAPGSEHLLVLRYNLTASIPYVNDSVLTPSADGIPGKVPCGVDITQEPPGIVAGDGVTMFRTSSGFEQFAQGHFDLVSEGGGEHFSCTSIFRTGKTETQYWYSVGGTTATGFTYQFPTTRSVAGQGFNYADYPCEGVPLGSIYSSASASETIDTYFVVNWCNVFNIVEFGPSLPISAAITAVENPDSLHLIDHMDVNLGEGISGVRMPGTAVILKSVLGENEFGVGGSSTYTPVYYYASWLPPISTEVLNPGAMSAIARGALGNLSRMYIVNTHTHLETDYETFSQGKGNLNRYLDVFSIREPYTDAAIWVEESFDGAVRYDTNGSIEDKKSDGIVTEDQNDIYFLGWA